MKTKKWIALLLAVLIAVSLTGCLGNLYTKVMTIEDREISSGLYLLMQLSAYNEASNLKDDPDKDVLKQKIEGQSATSWIRNRTEELCLEYVAVSKLCSQHEIELSAESQSQVEETMGYWDMISDYYTQNGISMETWRRQLENSALSNQLFQFLYGEGGEKAPSDAELKERYGEKYAHIRYISLSLTDAMAGDTAIDEVANALLEKLRGGKALEELAEEDLGELYMLLGKEYVPEDAAAAISDNYVSYDPEISTLYTEDFLVTLKESPVGSFGVTRTETSIILYERIIMFEDEDAFTEMKESVLSSVCDGDYREYLESVYSTYAVSKVFGAEWYLRPSKIKDY